MKDLTVRRRYAAPAVRKLEHLADVGGVGMTTSNTPTPKGGCFQPKSDYEPPALEKREKLSDVAGAPTVSGKTA